MPAATYSPIPVSHPVALSTAAAPPLAGRFPPMVRLGICLGRRRCRPGQQKGRDGFHLALFEKIMPAATYSPIPVSHPVALSTARGSAARRAVPADGQTGKLFGPPSLPAWTAKRARWIPSRPHRENNAGSDYSPIHVSHPVPLTTARGAALAGRFAPIVNLKLSEPPSLPAWPRARWIPSRPHRENHPAATYSLIHLPSG